MNAKNSVLIIYAEAIIYLLLYGLHDRTFNPHSSSLTNEEDLANIFGQSVQICCGEKEKEENNGNCKVFCVTRKLNKKSMGT